jgi:two-component system NtrC family sensor kinase
MTKFLTNLKLSSRLLLSFVIVILFIGFYSLILGGSLIHRNVPQVQDVLEVDLSAAREIYRQQLSQLADAARLTARQRFLRESVLKSDWGEGLAIRLEAIQQSEDIDILAITDLRGNVLLRITNPSDKSNLEAFHMIVEKVMQDRREYASAVRLSGDELARENSNLAYRARIDVVSTSYARPQLQNDSAAGMVIMAGTPITSDNGTIIAVLCAGQLLNRQTALVDHILNTLYRREKYDDKDVAVVAIFLGDKRIATSATNPSGERAIGTLVSEEVYNRVVLRRESWFRRGFVINDWYLTAYEPILNPRGEAIGMLGLGLLESKFNQSEEHAANLFIVLTLIALVLAVVLCYILSTSIMRPLNALIAATEKMAGGASLQPVKLDHSPPEIAALGQSFNSMLQTIHERDLQLRRQTHEKLVRSDRLAMIGQLAAGVAHEINNPLGSILLFTRLLMQQVPPDGRVKENLDRIEKETKRCHGIVRNLLDFARQREPHIEEVDVNQLVDQTLSLFENQFLFHNVEIVRNYAPELPHIRGDQSQLQQVLMNIIINAADAMDGKGKITIETKDGEAGSGVDISISDTGCGISSENLERIFDPFFTTKGVGHGTGLGLSVSYGIIQKHKGDLSVISAPGVGSTFTISLPMSAEDQPNAAR